MANFIELPCDFHHNTQLTFVNVDHIISVSPWEIDGVVERSWINMTDGNCYQCNEPPSSVKSAIRSAGCEVEEV